MDGRVLGSEENPESVSLVCKRNACLRRGADPMGEARLARTSAFA